jgi:hypothetical protein
MAKRYRYIGDAVITIENVGRTDDNRAKYEGTVRVGKYTWKFDDLASGVGGVSSGRGYGYPDDSPEAYDAMAGSAVSFASYYTTHNRGDDAPEWAPPPEVADAIDEAVGWAQRDNGEYEVRRSPKGKVHEEEAVMHEMSLSEARPRPSPASRHNPNALCPTCGIEAGRETECPDECHVFHRKWRDKYGTPDKIRPPSTREAPAPTRSAHHAPSKKRSR